jgi:hypothetical protein
MYDYLLGGQRKITKNLRIDGNQVENRNQDFWKYAVGVLQPKPLSQHLLCAGHLVCSSTSTLSGEGQDSRILMPDTVLCFARNRLVVKALPPVWKEMLTQIKAYEVFM